VLVNTIIIFLAYLTVGIVGAVASVYFANCDPLLNGEITNGDQVRARPLSCMIAVYDLGLLFAFLWGDSNNMIDM
jgi:hypothetical protein